MLARVNRAPLGTLRALYDNERKQSLTGLPLVHLGLALSLQGDKARGAKAIAEGFARDAAIVPNTSATTARRLRDDALMIALVHEHGLAKPEFDARAVALGRELDARRKQRLVLAEHAGAGRARAPGQGADGRAGQAGVGSVEGRRRRSEAAPGATDRPRCSTTPRWRAACASTPKGEPPLYASLEVAGVPRTRAGAGQRR